MPCLDTGSHTSRTVSRCMRPRLHTYSLVPQFRFDCPSLVQATLSPDRLRCKDALLFTGMKLTQHFFAAAIKCAPLASAGLSGCASEGAVGDKCNATTTCTVGEADGAPSTYTCTLSGNTATWTGPPPANCTGVVGVTGVKGGYAHMPCHIHICTGVTGLD